MVIKEHQILALKEKLSALSAENKRKGEVIASLRQEIVLHGHNKDPR